MTAPHLQTMTAQEYILQKLEELKPTKSRSQTNSNELADIVFAYVTTKKFRKYAASPELLEEIRETIRLNISHNEPISFVYPHGMYKLWRLEESPEADWAELFAFMHYISWLKPICEVYEPGVWFDFYADDLLVPVINNIPLEDIRRYETSYRSILDYLKQYIPLNFKITLTGVGSKFESNNAFYEKLEYDSSRLANELPGGLPELDAKRVATIELNANPSTEQKEDPLWREKIALIHDAYLKYTKAETKYHFHAHKIRVFTAQLPSRSYLAVGTTKDSIAKFWVGVGALRPANESYRQVILTPKQLATAEYTWEPVNIPGLPGKNFQRVRVLN
jgi:hypothetical protein